MLVEMSPAIIIGKECLYKCSIKFSACYYSTLYKRTTTSVLNITIIDLPNNKFYQLL